MKMGSQSMVTLLQTCLQVGDYKQPPLVSKKENVQRTWPVGNVLAHRAGSLNLTINTGSGSEHYLPESPVYSEADLLSVTQHTRD